MLPPQPPGPCNLWHHSLAARDLMDQLEPRDVRLTRVCSCPGPDHLAWHPDTDFGAATFTALTHLRQLAVGPAFAQASNDCARALALAAAQRAPTVPAAVSTRFGDPARWLGHGPLEATRRFRANWT